MKIVHETLISFSSIALSKDIDGISLKFSGKTPKIIHLSSSMLFNAELTIFENSVLFGKKWYVCNINKKSLFFEYKELKYVEEAVFLE